MSINRTTVLWLIVVATVAMVLGGASLIVTRHPATPSGAAQSGFLH